ncbi:5'-3' exonuclease [Bacillus solimangrovi]|uniref:5'-3' exonuclease n=1 Tax=Bacillus solimangrovi TaxID=1305675 RepID=A0A1E5LJM9_9BACI|nr:5'-3' exonuclease H3TH domain-containing protein [Bacillus solimangrovi]OEH94302.1 5'-3' exonuclease [Bacillus solimangrovi]
MENENRVLLVDGMALLFRSFYATAMSGYYMVNSKGVPTNAIYGFVKHLLAAKQEIKPTHIVCCWDMGSKTYRTELYPEYKANRGEPPVELIPQFDLVKDVVEAFDIPNVGLVGYEADDCLGTLAKQYEENAKVTILTGDQDLYQLINPNIEIMLLQKGYGNYKFMNEQMLMEERGLLPQQIVDLKALMGDTSDNYPGVKGIGEKTAIKFLLQYESIEGLLSNIDGLTKAQRTKIENNIDMLHLSRKLAAIECNVPVSCDLVDGLININSHKVTTMLEELEFKNINKLLEHL